MSMGPLPSPRTLPLFPLPRTVLIPGSVLRLFIYEPRYKAMIGRCLQEKVPFGVLLLRSAPEVEGMAEKDAACRTGGSGEIIWHRVVGQGGEMVIGVKGARRFRVTEFITGAPYLQGRVEYLRDDWAEEEQRVVHLQALRKGLARTLAHGPPVLTERAEELVRMEDPALLADVIVAGLPLEPHRKQAFLETLDPVQRAVQAAEILQREGFRLSVLDNLQSGKTDLYNRN